MGSPSRTITVANDATICELIATARKRLVILLPAVSVPVAKAVCKQWKGLGRQRVNVIVDLDPEVFRLGYGEFDGLKLLEATAQAIGAMLHRQKGIRIGVIVADEATLVFNPIPALVEAGPSSEQTPNAVLLDATPPSLEKELGLGTNGIKDQTVGLDKATKADMAAVELDLKENPPQKFDIARTVRVFNAHFEFVEFEMTGIHIGRKTMPIPAELMGLAKDEATKKRLRANFRIIDAQDSLSGERLLKAKAWLVKSYLASLPGYGNVVLRSVKSDFQKKVNQLERCIELFKLAIKKSLAQAMEANRKTLVEGLLPSVMASPPAHWRKYYGSTPDKSAMRTLLEKELAAIAGSPERLVGDMKLKAVFKGVTYELLSDEKFMAATRKALPMLRRLHDEYDAAKGNAEPEQLPLFDHSDSKQRQ